MRPHLSHINQSIMYIKDHTISFKTSEITEKPETPDHVVHILVRHKQVAIADDFEYILHSSKSDISKDIVETFVYTSWVFAEKSQSIINQS